MIAFSHEIKLLITPCFSGKDPKEVSLNRVFKFCPTKRSQAGLNSSCKQQPMGSSLVLFPQNLIRVISKQMGTGRGSLTNQ